MSCPGRGGGRGVEVVRVYGAGDGTTPKFIPKAGESLEPVFAFHHTHTTFLRSSTPVTSRGWRRVPAVRMKERWM